VGHPCYPEQEVSKRPILQHLSIRLVPQAWLGNLALELDLEHDPYPKDPSILVVVDSHPLLARKSLGRYSVGESA
jgi:hypothetical protein